MQSVWVLFSQQSAPCVRGSLPEPPKLAGWCQSSAGEQHIFVSHFYTHTHTHTQEILLVKVQQSWSYLDCTVQTVSGIETMACEAALPIFMLQLCLRTVQTKWPHDCVALTFNRSMGESNIRAMSRATLPWPRMTAVSHPRSGLSWKVMRMKHNEIRLERSRVVFIFIRAGCHHYSGGFFSYCLAKYQLFSFLKILLSHISIGCAVMVQLGIH